MVTKVSDILQEKGGQIFSVTSETTVFDTIRLMVDKNIGDMAKRIIKDQKIAFKNLAEYSVENWEK
jgi:hypothetical protein